MAEELRLEGFSVIEADRADDALTYIEAGEQVDLVFSDIQTTGSLDGLQLAETLRDKYPDILVILTSGKAEPKHFGTLWTFVPKPYDVTQTIALMSSIIDLSSKVSRRTPMRDPCILIVEQDLLARTPLAEYLRECGYLVH